VRDREGSPRPTMLDLTVDEKGGGEPPLLHQGRGRVVVATPRDGGAGYHRNTKEKGSATMVSPSLTRSGQVEEEGRLCVRVFEREREREWMGVVVWVGFSFILARSPVRSTGEGFL
jgi:hypothetical protein